MYHSLDSSGSVVSTPPAVFAEQMSCLTDLGFRGISLREAVSHRETNGQWPSRSIVLTFDDGFANFHESAWPVLSRRGFTATVFIVTGHMGRFNDWETPPEGLGRRRILSWEQADELAGDGIEIGSHTHSHRDLKALTAVEAKREIVMSREQIEKCLKTRVDSFAYPYGRLSPASIDIVRQEFRAACTTMLRRADADPSHALPRIDMYYVKSRRSMERLIMGQLDRYLDIRQMGRAIRAAVATRFQ